MKKNYFSYFHEKRVSEKESVQKSWFFLAQIMNNSNIILNKFFFFCYIFLKTVETSKTCWIGKINSMTFGKWWILIFMVTNCILNQNSMFVQFVKWHHSAGHSFSLCFMSFSFLSIFKSQTFSNRRKNLWKFQHIQ